MKKNLLLIWVLILLWAIVGCSGQKPASKTAPSGNTEIPLGTPAASPPMVSAIPTPKPTSKPKLVTEPKKDVIIAKSDENVASKEKEDILNDIDKLLDDVLKNVNEIDADSDMNIQE